MKCGREGCEKDSVLLDYRPSYIDEDGEEGCLGKMPSCGDCVSLTSEDWLAGKEPNEVV